VLRALDQACFLFEASLLCGLIALCFQSSLTVYCSLSLVAALDAVLRLGGQFNLFVSEWVLSWGNYPLENTTPLKRNIIVVNI